MCPSNSGRSDLTILISKIFSPGHPAIGIGGALPCSPLPHHRTGGSAYGGSAGYAKPSKSGGRRSESDFFHQLLGTSWTFGCAFRRARFGPFLRSLRSFTPPLL